MKILAGAPRSVCPYLCPARVSLPDVSLRPRYRPRDDFNDRSLGNHSTMCVILVILFNARLATVCRSRARQRPKSCGSLTILLSLQGRHTHDTRRRPRLARNNILVRVAEFLRESSGPEVLSASVSRVPKTHRLGTLPFKLRSTNLNFTIPITATNRVYGTYRIAIEPR